MAEISIKTIATATTKVQAMSFDEKNSLADEIFKSQPNLLASVLALGVSNIPYERIEVSLNYLFVCYISIKDANISLPLITEDIQEKCLIRIGAKSRFIEGLSSSLRKQAIGDQIKSHGQPGLLAVALGELRTNGLAEVQTEKEKRVSLVVLNIAETIAYVTKDI